MPGRIELMSMLMVVAPVGVLLRLIGFGLRMRMGLVGVRFGRVCVCWGGAGVTIVEW